MPGISRWDLIQRLKG